MKLLALIPSWGKRLRLCYHNYLLICTYLSKISELPISAQSPHVVPTYLQSFDIHNYSLWVWLCHQQNKLQYLKSWKTINLVKKLFHTRKLVFQHYYIKKCPEFFIESSTTYYCKNAIGNVKRKLKNPSTLFRTFRS